MDSPIFSRSSHIKSLGLYSETEGLDLESDTLVSLEPNKSPLLTTDLQLGKHSQLEVTIRGGASQGVGQEGTQLESWTEFEEEFSEALRVSEDRIESGLSRPQMSSLSSPDKDPRRDLLIEMITALHDSRPSTAATAKGGSTGGADSGRNPPSGGESIQEEEEGKEGSGLFKLPPQTSPTRPRRQLLSLSTLETIPEAELDRVLEVVETAGPPAHSSPLPSQDSDVLSLTDSDVAASPSESPQKKRLAWGLKETPSPDSDHQQLMKQLRQLSEAQSNGLPAWEEGEERSGTTPITTSRKTLSDVVRPKPGTHMRDIK